MSELSFELLLRLNFESWVASLMSMSTAEAGVMEAASTPFGAARVGIVEGGAEDVGRGASVVHDHRAVQTGARRRTLPSRARTRKCRRLSVTRSPTDATSCTPLWYCGSGRSTRRSGGDGRVGDVIPVRRVAALAAATRAAILAGYDCMSA